MLPTLATPRLVLRSFNPDDASRVHALLADRDVAAMMASVPHPYTLDAAQAWVASHPATLAAGSQANFAVVDKVSDQLVGTVGLMREAAHRRAELGYWMGKLYWRRGLATEAARAVVAYAFAELSLQRLQATCLCDNTASRRVLQKLGMAHEGVLRGYLHKWGRQLDVDMYAMRAAESP